MSEMESYVINVIIVYFHRVPMCNLKYFFQAIIIEVFDYNVILYLLGRCTYRLIDIIDNDVQIIGLEGPREQQIKRFNIVFARFCTEPENCIQNFDLSKNGAFKNVSDCIFNAAQRHSNALYNTDSNIQYNFMSFSILYIYRHKVVQTPTVQGCEWGGLGPSPEKRHFYNLYTDAAADEDRFTISKSRLKT